jgi:hypothetical protein
MQEKHYSKKDIVAKEKNKNGKKERGKCWHE